MAHLKMGVDGFGKVSIEGTDAFVRAASKAAQSLLSILMGYQLQQVRERGESVEDFQREWMAALEQGFIEQIEVSPGVIEMQASVQDRRRLHADVPV